MATDYTVVLFSRQHLGNEAGVFNDVEPNVVFVGRAKDLPFDCPGINTAEAAVLMFQSRDVDHQRNILRVNGVDVLGVLPASQREEIMHPPVKNVVGLLVGEMRPAKSWLG